MIIILLKKSMNHCCNHITPFEQHCIFYQKGCINFRPRFYFPIDNVLVMFPYEMTFCKEPDTIRFVKFHRKWFSCLYSMTQPTKEPVHRDVRNGCKWKYIRKLFQNSGGQDPPKLVEKHSSNKIWGENSDGKRTSVKLPFISFQRKGLTPETRDKTSRQTFHKKFTASHFTKP